MIDEEKTYGEKGYYSTDLKPQSHKHVWAVCEGDDCQREGGRGRWVTYQQYRKMCHSCAHKTKEYRKKQMESSKIENLSDESRKKMRENHADVSGENNPMYNKNHTMDARIRMGKNSPDVSGENNPNWKGGINSERNVFYGSDEYAYWRNSVFERDYYTCQECRCVGGVLNSHHILPYRDWKDPQFSLNVDNGITLCKECHDKIRWKEYEFFNKYFDIANGVGKK